jgi:O-antigen ligase
VPDTLVKRLASTGTNISELSFGGRFRLWVAGVNAFTQRPLVGYGTGAFKQAITPQLGDLSQVAHDTFISVLVEEGLVGLLFYLLMLAAAFRAVLRLAHLERRFALVITGTLIVAMLPLTWEDKKPVWFILASLVGLSQTAVVVRVPVLGQPRRLRPAVVPSQSPEPLASPASGCSREL